MMLTLAEGVDVGNGLRWIFLFISSLLLLFYEDIKAPPLSLFVKLYQDTTHLFFSEVSVKTVALSMWSESVIPYGHQQD
jgi:hypothetical protein